MLAPLNHLRDRLPLPGGSGREPEPPSSAFGPLRALAAELLLITGVEVTRAALAARKRQEAWQDRPLDFERRDPDRWSYAASLAPALLAPMAAAAHLKQILRPSGPTTTANRLLNAAVLGVGLVELAGPLLRGRQGDRSSLPPLALASVGLLGLVLERQEQAARRDRQRLQRRADVVERLVPRRRPKLDHIVVHV